MSEINNLLVASLPVLFILVAIITQKDLAITAAALSCIGILAIESGHNYPTEMMIIIGLNSTLAVIAASYNGIRKCNLSLVVAILATGQAAINLIQMFSSLAIYGTITALIEFVMLIALVFMDGRKGLVDGVAGGFSSFISHRLFRHRINNNNKGRT